MVPSIAQKVKMHTPKLYNLNLIPKINTVGEYSLLQAFSCWKWVILNSCGYLKNEADFLIYRKNDRIENTQKWLADWLGERYWFLKSPDCMTFLSFPSMTGPGKERAQNPLLICTPDFSLREVTLTLTMAHYNLFLTLWNSHLCHDIRMYKHMHTCMCIYTHIQMNQMQFLKIYSY